MASRWAKTPEWLLDALLSLERDRYDATPGNALLVHATLWLRFADWTTSRARCSHAQIGAATEMSRRTIQRTLDTLARVRAVRPLESGKGWRAVNNYEIAVDNPLHVASLVTPPLVTGDASTRRETAGHRAHVASLVTQPIPEQELFTDAMSSWGLQGVLQIPDERAVPMPDWLRERFGRDQTLRSLRAADERGSHLPSVGRRGGESPREGPEVQADRAAGEASPAGGTG